MERALREWRVAGGLVERDDGVLLVRNQRRGGSEDWSTPGGVIDDDDASVLSGLTREVAEETGLLVSEWSAPLYDVHALAPDMGWRMHCAVHLALSFTGELRVCDPDGIVVEATFVPARDCTARLADTAPWVREPLAAWLSERWSPGDGPEFRYEVHGTARGSLHVVRQR
jgi:8-oxo-dGTP pyrophosphatase MutT (NUDIX family)